VAPTALRPVLHRIGQPTRASGGLHADADCGMGDTTGPTTDLELERPLRTVPACDPRSGPEVHRHVRRGLSPRRMRDCPDAVSRPAGERRGGALRPHRSVPVSRLAADLERTTSRASPGRLRRTLRRSATAPRAGPQTHPIRQVRRLHRRSSRAQYVSSVAIVSVDCFTSMFGQRDVVFAPNRRCPVTVEIQRGRR